MEIKVPGFDLPKCRQTERVVNEAVSESGATLRQARDLKKRCRTLKK